MTTLLDRVVAGKHSSFALINRHGSAAVEVLVGPHVDVSLIADIPLIGEGGTPQEVLALVPFRQIRERGFAAHDDGSPLRCLVVHERAQVSIADLRALAPEPPELLGEQDFDISDADYAAVVGRIIANEIGRGEGSNFVIRRDFRAHTSMPAHAAVIAWMSALLEQEVGAAWTFAVCTPGRSMVGASPEQHLSVMPTGEPGRSIVQMNPIAGTYRHPAGGGSAVGLLEFLHSAKEKEELFMVVDEELKMMTRICTEEVRVRGPFLKQMSHLTHTEYVIEGKTRMHPLDALRLSMFAPTITGSPMQNACAVIADHEQSGRGYYSGALALFEVHERGAHSIDAPILIRTAYLNGAGEIGVPVGATLVRHSDPQGEVAETRAKAGGVLRALGARGATALPPSLDLSAVPGLDEALRSRNSGLADYWTAGEQASLTGRLSGTAVVIDAEDDFSAMLAQQLRSLGMKVELQAWSQSAIGDCDLLVAGPGPGDPLDLEDPRIARMHEVIRERRASGRPLLAVCLSHQILAAQLGLGLQRLDSPRQGLVLKANVLGQQALLGHYNTFSAVIEDASRPSTDFGAYLEAGGQHVSSLAGHRFASVQGHAESVLSRDGVSALQLLAARALA